VIIVNEDDDAARMISRFRSDISLRLQELVEAPLEPSDVDQSGSSMSVLCRTDWVEILVLRCVENPETLRIEVEISMPVETRPDRHIGQPERLPSIMIAHMEYLLKLLDVGFSLHVVGEEGLWITTSQFTGIPSPDVVQRLVPPQLK
jgi:hypothetical protein